MTDREHPWSIPEVVAQGLGLEPEAEPEPLPEDLPEWLAEIAARQCPEALSRTERRKR